MVPDWNVDTLLPSVSLYWIRGDLADFGSAYHNAGSAELSGLFSLPLAFAILVLILPCEFLLGKMILGWLPSSSTQKRREHLKD